MATMRPALSVWFRSKANRRRRRNLYSGHQLPLLFFGQSELIGERIGGVLDLVFFPISSNFQERKHHGLLVRDRHSKVERPAVPLSL